MQDQPSAIDLVDIVADFIRNHAMPQLQGHAAFHARVAANALDIVKRELQIAPKANAAEHARLKGLLGRDGSLEDLNRDLCDKLASGDISLSTPGLSEHLWEITLAKLAIDQPNYSGYVKALAETGGK